MKKSLIKLLKELYNYNDNQALEIYQIFYDSNSVGELLNFLLNQKGCKEKKQEIEIIVFI